MARTARWVSVMLLFLSIVVARAQNAYNVQLVGMLAGGKQPRLLRYMVRLGDGGYFQSSQTNGNRNGCLARRCIWRFCPRYR